MTHKIGLWAVVIFLLFATLAFAHTPSEQPPSNKMIIDAIAKEVIGKFPLTNFCAAATKNSNRLEINSIEVIDFHEEGKYWMVEAKLQCITGPSISPHTVVSFDYFKLSKDNQGMWKAELVMRNRAAKL